MLYISQILNEIYFQFKPQQRNGAHISFKSDNSKLIYPDRAVFDITQRGRLYYLKNIVSAENITFDLHIRP